MSNEKYPLCKAAGLTVEGFVVEVIRAADVEAMLAQAPVVYDGNSGLTPFAVETWGLVKHDEREHTMISSNFTNSKRTARLVCIQPIKQKTREERLEELVKDLCATAEYELYGQMLHPIVERAKRLLEAK